jgi:hypothetical protein
MLNAECEMMADRVEVLNDVRCVISGNRQLRRRAFIPHS